MPSLYFFLIVCLILSAKNILAQQNNISQAKELTTKLNNKVSKATSSDDIMNFIPNYTKNQPAKNYSNNDLITLGKEQLITNPTANFITQNMSVRGQFHINQQEKFITNSTQIENNAKQEEILNNYSYEKSCYNVDLNQDNLQQIHSCDNMINTTSNNCLVNQDVVFKTNYQYQCKQERIIKHKTCVNNLLLTCSVFSECGESLQPSFISANLKIDNYRGNINLHLAPTNHVVNLNNNDCEQTTGTIKFNIGNLAQVSEFALVGLNGYGYVDILVNDYAAQRALSDITFSGIFSTTKISNFLTNPSYITIFTYGAIFFSPTMRARFESNTCQYVQNNNGYYDLRPYLKTGSNIITIRNVAGNTKFLNYSLDIKLRANFQTKKCCNNWSKTWQENCS